MIRVQIGNAIRNGSQDFSAITGGLPGWAGGLRLAWLMLALVSPGTRALAAGETARTIRVVMDDAYALYAFRTEEGKLQGILIDQWQAWEKKTGIKGFVVDNPSAFYLLNKMGVKNDFRHSAPAFRDELRRAVRKGDAGLLRTVASGFAAATPAELRQIDEKWFGHTISRLGEYISAVAYGAAAALLLIAGLTGWNRTLQKRVLQRTAALSESEQRFRRLIGVMPVAVYVCDISGIIQSYNHHAVELWGREPNFGDPAQRYCASLRLYTCDGKLVPHEESKMAEVLRTGLPARDLEGVIERPNGSRITVLMNIAPLRNAKGELISAMNCFQDITERKRAEESVHQLSSQLLRLQDEERRKLALNLHDSTGQTLARLLLSLDRLRCALPELNPQLKESLTDCLTLGRRCANEIRLFSYLLHPPLLEELGLAGAVEDYAEGFARQSGIQMDLKVPTNLARLPREMELSLFRVLQESLTNVHRHSGSKTVSIHLTRTDRRILLEVQDNGCGLQLASEPTPEKAAVNNIGVGIAGMRERLRELGGAWRLSPAPTAPQ